MLDSQEWNTVAGKVLHLLIPARCRERRWVAPGIVVKGEEVASLVVGTTVHVLSHLQPVGVDIRGGVSDWNLAVVPVPKVLPHVTSHRLDVWSGCGGGIVVDHLVTGEESEGVVIFGEGVNCGEDVLKVDVVV